MQDVVFSLHLNGQNHADFQVKIEMQMTSANAKPAKTMTPLNIEPNALHIEI